jgi:hypothetical protein
VGSVPDPGRCGVSAAEPVPSNEWAAVEHLWEDVAEAWFRPEPDGPTYRFRVPKDRFETDDAGRPLTVETLLAAASIPKDQVEFWRLADAPGSEAYVSKNYLKLVTFVQFAIMTVYLVSL